MPRKRIIITAALLIIATGFWYLQQPPGIKQDNAPKSTLESQSKPSAESGVTVGKKAPLHSLKDMEGRSVSLITPGQITVLNFWATWCPPCREEMPELDRFSRSRGQIAFYAVNIEESTPKVAEFMQKNNYTIPVLFDSNGAVASSYRISAIPTTLIIDGNGVIRYRKTGPVTQAELVNIIKGL